MPGKTLASKLSKDLPYGQSGIRRLSARIRCAPAFCQSSSIQNSLRSVKQTAVLRLKSSSSSNLADSAILPTSKSLHPSPRFAPPEAIKLKLVMPLLSPQRMNDHLRYRSADWTVSAPWPERFQLCWYLRLRLENVSKLPFLSACT